MILPILNGNYVLLSGRGMRLGAFSALASAVMDQAQVSFHDGRLYSDGKKINVYDGILIFYKIIKYSKLLNFFKFIHSAVYSFVHRLMHKVTAFRPIHKHHHKYKEIVLPSNANAVSSNEFIFAYMLPFVVGCALINPTSNSLSVATLIVSGFNICIHSVSLSKHKWFKWFVTPSEHLHHHETKSSIYSAPTISWGKILKRK